MLPEEALKQNALRKRDDAAGIVGWIATIVSILMWSSLVDQIRLNLTGQKGSIIFACAVVLNCTLWVTYGLLKNPRLWPVFWSNLPGIFLGLIAVITAL